MQADEAFCIGPAQSQQSYLNKDRILDVARWTGAQVSPHGICIITIDITSIFISFFVQVY